MDPSVALHTIYRRALYERYEFMTARYSELPNGGRLSNGHDYTDEAKAIFPRYNVIQAVIDSVEELDTDALAPLERLREDLEVRTALADSVLTEGSHDVAIARVQDDERGKLREPLNSIDLRTQDEVAPLPYRRVLSSKECDELYVQLRNRWDVQEALWHPMIGPDVPNSVLVVDADPILALAETRPEFIASWLSTIATPRIYELREFGPSVITDASEFVPTYNGAEGFWFDSSLDWLVYASHHGSVSFAGTIRGSVESLWPEVRSALWPAP